MKKINVSKKNWKKLNEIKNKYNFVHVNESVSFLLEKYAHGEDVSLENHNEESESSFQDLFEMKSKEIDEFLKNREM